MLLPPRPLLALALLIGACSVESAGVGQAGPGGGDDSSGDDGDGQDDPPPPDCVGPLGAAQDPAALPACCEALGGAAHCVASDVVPADFQAEFTACDGGGLCVPDPLIETGGVLEPVDCASLDGAPGVCVSVCLAQVAAYATILPSEGCAADERCAPCINPFTSEPTGVCELELSCATDGGGGDGGGGGGTPPPPPPADCCDGRGVCVTEAAAGDSADLLDQDACDDDLVCAPTELIDGDFQAQPCTADSILADGPGACVPDCLANVGLFEQNDCGAGYACVPCETFLGETGACDYLPE